MTGERSWNPRYVSYAIAHGEIDPAAMLERDKAARPHGCMLNFMIWNAAEWRAWYAEHPDITRTAPESEDFTAWQRERAERSAETLRSAS
jgi:hypothetical protein